MADRRDSVKRWEPILDVWQELAAAPNAWVGWCVWGFLGFWNSHFLLRRTVICCVCSSGFFGFSRSLMDSAVTHWTFWTGHYKTKSFHFYASSSFVLVLFHCGLHSEETRRHMFIFDWTPPCWSLVLCKLDMGHVIQLVNYLGLQLYLDFFLNFYIDTYCTSTDLWNCLMGSRG